MMLITEPMIPMIIVPLAFLFVLLIILVNKAPKAGAWVIGGVILQAPILLYRLAMACAGPEEAIPLLVVPASFLFVLLIIVLAKAPKAGAGLVIALVLMAIVGIFVAIPVSHRRGEESSSVLQMRQSTGTGSGLSIVRDDFEAVHLDVSETSSGLKQLTPPTPALSPIWSEGVEQEFDADVYPSKVAAVRALGPQIGRVVRELPREANSPQELVLFQQEHDRRLITELRSALQRLLPESPLTLEADQRNLGPGEAGITVRFADTHENVAPWARSSGAVVVSRGAAEASIFTADRRAAVHEFYAEKPWVEDFAGFANARPDLHFVVARSYETCTSESEASRQALDDARAQLTTMLGKRTEWRVAGLKEPQVTRTDVLNDGFVVDRFAQSFDGSAGRIWRQALLIDVSGAKLVQLAEQKADEAHSARMSWARMGLSVVGVLVLIGAIYFFLNMATMGYYEWSLRIAGIVLAIIAIISVLMIVQ